MFPSTWLSRGAKGGGAITKWKAAAVGQGLTWERGEYKAIRHGYREKLGGAGNLSFPYFFLARAATWAASTPHGYPILRDTTPALPPRNSLIFTSLGMSCVQVREPRGCKTLPGIDWISSPFAWSARCNGTRSIRLGRASVLSRSLSTYWRKLSGAGRAATKGSVQNDS